MRGSDSVFNKARLILNGKQNKSLFPMLPGIDVDKKPKDQPNSLNAKSD